MDCQCRWLLTCVIFWGLTAEHQFSKMTALGVASRCSRAAHRMFAWERSTDALVASDDHRRRDFVLWDSFFS